jgi:hypothetical protein
LVGPLLIDPTRYSAFHRPQAGSAAIDNGHPLVGGLGCLEATSSTPRVRSTATAMPGALRHRRDRSPDLQRYAVRRRLRMMIADPTGNRLLAVRRADRAEAVLP